MAHYLKLEKFDILEITNRYQLPLTGFKPIEQGSGNTNYLVNTEKGKYILTIFEIESAHVDKMCEVLLLLEEHTFPAPKIFKLHNGDMLTFYQEKPVMIKPYIIGKVIDDLDPDQLNQLGSKLAQLHEIPVVEGLREQHGYMLKEVPQVIEKANNQPYLRWFISRYRDLMQNIPSGLSTGLIHGDLFTDNVLFEKQKIKAILDFEDVCEFYFVFDIGMAIVGLCRDNERINLVKASSFLNGYQKKRLITGAERESLQEFIELAALLTSVWRFWKYNIDLPGTQKSNHYLEMVNIARDIAKKSKSRFQRSVL